MKLNILGNDYAVFLSTVRELDSLGTAHTSNLEIKIAADIPFQQQQSTMIHEIIEAVQWHLGLKLPHRVIAALETGLYQVLTANGVDLAPLLKEKEG